MSKSYIENREQMPCVAWLCGVGPWVGLIMCPDKTLQPRLVGLLDCHKMLLYESVKKVGLCLFWLLKPFIHFNDHML